MAEPCSEASTYNVLVESSLEDSFGVPDDVASVATEEWMLVDGEEEDGELVCEDNCSETSSDLEPTVEVQPQAIVEVPALAACVHWSAPLSLGHGSLAQCSGYSGDITASFAQALEGFPGVPSIFCLGRVCIFPDDAADGTAALPVAARVVVFNNGSFAWPEETFLRCVAGNSLGLETMPCGGLLPGDGAELVLDLAVPAAGQRGTGERSAWVLTDANHAPFGPVLALEVVWV